LSYLREFEHMTLARILLARNSQAEARGLLERLLEAAQVGGRMHSVIEILILQALAHQQQGELPAALAVLEHALNLAQPEGYLRIFIREGANLAELLRKVAARGSLPDYTGRLLAPLAKNQPGPIEPLSQRELDILRLFKTDLSGPEIAQELVIALSTVRTHTKSIYNKLNVNNRRAAVRRASELGLI
jgi:LuxR family maltose regulon positive regulatory protein